MMDTDDLSTGNYTPLYSTDITPWFVESGKRAFAAVLARFMCNAFEALGAVVLGADPGTLRAACGRVPLNPDDCVRIARRRQPGFSLSRRSDGPLGAQDDGSRADLKTLVSGEATLWCFGAELSLATGDTLWLFLDRRSSQGLGWAYVAALKRVLAAGPRDGGP